MDVECNASYAKSNRKRIPVGSTSYYVLLPILERPSTVPVTTKNPVFATFQRLRNGDPDSYRDLNPHRPTESPLYRHRLQYFIRIFSEAFEAKKKDFPREIVTYLDSQDWLFLQCAIAWKVHAFYRELTKELEDALTLLFKILRPSIVLHVYVMPRTSDPIALEKVFRRFPRIWEDDPVFVDGMPTPANRVPKTKIEFFVPDPRLRATLLDRVLGRIVYLRRREETFEYNSKQYAVETAQLFAAYKDKPLGSYPPKDLPGKFSPFLHYTSLTLPFVHFLYSASSSRKTTQDSRIEANTSAIHTTIRNGAS